MMSEDATSREVMSAEFRADAEEGRVYGFFSTSIHLLCTLRYHRLLLNFLHPPRTPCHSSEQFGMMWLLETCDEERPRQ